MNYELLGQRIADAAKSDEEFLADYNANTVVVQVHNVPMGIVDLHMKKALYFKLSAAKRNEVLPEIVRDVAASAIELPASPHIPTLDVWDADFQMSMAILRNANVFNDADVDGLLGLGERLTSQSMIDHDQLTEQSDIDAMRLEPKRLKLEQLMTEAQAAHGELSAGRDVDLTAWGITD